jgi:hypothetical protein
MVIRKPLFGFSIVRFASTFLITLPISACVHIFKSGGKSSKIFPMTKFINVFLQIS